MWKPNNTQLAVGASALSFSFGAGLGYLLTKRALTQKFEAQVAQEVAETKHFYQTLAQPSLEKLAEQYDLPIEINDETDLMAASQLIQRAQEVIDAQGYIEQVDGVTEEMEPEVLEEVNESIEKNIFDQVSSEDSVGLEDPNFDLEAEKKTRTSEKPYIICHEEFLEGVEGGMDQSQLTWYAGDKVLCDSRDQPINEVHRVVGTANMEKFGHGSGDENVVYIRNELLELDFEVVRSSGKFSIEVLGMELKHSESRKQPKFRHED